MRLWWDSKKCSSVILPWIVNSKHYYLAKGSVFCTIRKKVNIIPNNQLEDFILRHNNVRTYSLFTPRIPSTMSKSITTELLSQQNINWPHTNHTKITSPVFQTLRYMSRWCERSMNLTTQWRNYCRILTLRIRIITRTNKLS